MFVGSRMRSVERWVVIDEVEDLLDYCRFFGSLVYKVV